MIVPAHRTPEAGGNEVQTASFQKTAQAHTHVFWSSLSTAKTLHFNAVGRAYERLAYNADYENIELVGYLSVERRWVAQLKNGRGDLGARSWLARVGVKIKDDQSPSTS